MSAAQPGNSVYIRAGRLVTGRPGHTEQDAEVIEDAALRIEDGRIVAAGPAAQVPPPTDPMVPTIDYTAYSVLPGLVDAHVHLTFRRGETSVQHAIQVSDELALLRGVEAARKILAAGVTTVRDCAARGRIAQALRDGVRDGLIAGPRILASGPPITTTAGHLWALGYEADSAKECRRAVRRLVKEGADFIKVCATGGGMTPGSVVGRAQYTVEELRAVAEDAHRLSLRVAAHCHGVEGIARAVEAGVNTIEHVSWYDADGRRGAFDEQVARQMAERGIFACIASSASRELVGRGTAATTAESDEASGFRPETAGRRLSLDRWELARRAAGLGVAVCFATDAIYGNWDDGHDLSYLAQALVETGEFAPGHVLRMITAIPAATIGWEDRVGTLEEGRLADLLVVDGNPTTNIRALHNVVAVHQSGNRVVG
jgi:imidazolonepropionase-like amidohydrolase